MKFAHTTKRFIVIVIAILGILNFSFAQDLEEVINALNNGVNAYQEENFQEAIDYLNECIDLAEEFEEDQQAEEAITKAEGLIPKAYYGIGNDLLAEKKFGEAIKQYEETIEICDFYGDEETKTNVIKGLPKILYNYAASKLKSGDTEEAIELCDKALSYNSDYSLAYYLKGFAYKKLGDDEKLKIAIKKAIETGTNTNNNKVVARAKNFGYKHFLAKGNASKGAAKYDEAIALINSALEFNDENPQAYLLLLDIYVTNKEWNNAIDAGKKALEYQADVPEKEAQIYYLLGQAYQNAGNTSEACVAYKKAALGAYKEYSEYQIKNVLKCE